MYSLQPHGLSHGIFSYIITVGRGHILHMYLQPKYIFISVPMQIYLSVVSTMQQSRQGTERTAETPSLFFLGWFWLASLRSPKKTGTTTSSKVEETENAKNPTSLNQCLRCKGMVAYCGLKDKDNSLNYYKLF